MNKLNFGDIEVSKKQFYESKKGVKLSDVDVSKIVEDAMKSVTFLLVIWVILM